MNWVAMCGRSTAVNFFDQLRVDDCTLIFSYLSPQLWYLSFRSISKFCYISLGSGNFEVVFVFTCHYTIASLFRNFLISQLLTFYYACAIVVFR